MFTVSLVFKCSKCKGKFSDDLGIVWIPVAISRSYKNYAFLIIYQALWKALWRSAKNAGSKVNALYTWLNTLKYSHSIHDYWKKTLR